MKDIISWCDGDCNDPDCNYCNKPKKFIAGHHDL